MRRPGRVRANSAYGCLRARLQRARYCPDRVAGNWEFREPKGGKSRPVAWQSLLVDAGIPHARLHDARHTAATLLLEQGVDIRVVQEILGHSSITVTKRYADVTSRLARDAADPMGRALWG
jgi:integrase